MNSFRLRFAPTVATLLLYPVPSYAVDAALQELVPLRAPAPVPTTKILAIGTFTTKAAPATWQKILPDEVRATVELYLDGKIDQWFVKQDQSGVVFLLNVTDPVEARAMLETLPFGPTGLMEFQITSLGPISPLRLLLSNPAR